MEEDKSSESDGMESPQQSPLSVVYSMSGIETHVKNMTLNKGNQKNDDYEAESEETGFHTDSTIDIEYYSPRKKAKKDMEENVRRKKINKSDGGWTSDELNQNQNQVFLIDDSSSDGSEMEGIENSAEQMPHCSKKMPTIPEKRNKGEKISQKRGKSDNNSKSSQILLNKKLLYPELPKENQGEAPPLDSKCQKLVDKAFRVDKILKRIFFNSDFNSVITYRQINKFWRKSASSFLFIHTVRGHTEEHECHRIELQRNFVAYFQSISSSSPEVPETIIYDCELDITSRNPDYCNKFPDFLIKFHKTISTLKLRNLSAAKKRTKWINALTKMNNLKELEIQDNWHCHQFGEFLLEGITLPNVKTLSLNAIKKYGGLEAAMKGCDAFDFESNNIMQRVRNLAPEILGVFPNLEGLDVQGPFPPFLDYLRELPPSKLKKMKSLTLTFQDAFNHSYFGKIHLLPAGSLRALTLTHSSFQLSSLSLPLYTKDKATAETVTIILSRFAPTLKVLGLEDIPITSGEEGVPISVPVMPNLSDFKISYRHLIAKARQHSTEQILKMIPDEAKDDFKDPTHLLVMMLSMQHTDTMNKTLKGGDEINPIFHLKFATANGQKRIDFFRQFPTWETLTIKPTSAKEDIDKCLYTKSNLSKFIEMFKPLEEDWPEELVVNLPRFKN